MSGEPPDDWRAMAFSEAVAINPKRQLPREGSVPFLDMASLPLNGADVSVSEAREISSGGSKFQRDDTLFARITPCAENGKLGFVQSIDGGQVAQGSTEFIVMAARDGLTLPEYVRHLAAWSEVRGQAIGLMEGTSGRQRVPNGAFNEIEVLVPPLDEQHRIAETLRSVDNALATYDAISEAAANVFQRLSSLYFIDPADYVGPHPLGSFGELFDIKGGSQPPKSTFVYEPKPGFVRLLQIRDFERDDKAAYISESSSSVRCREDDILIARYGASVGRILTGKAGAYNVALTKVAFRSDQISRRYAYHWLRSDYFQNRIAAVSGRSAQAGFNKEDLFPTKVVLPPFEEQRIIADILDDLEKQISLSERTRKTALLLKSSLLSDLLSGRVRVPA